jgi:hypothetical protein
VGALSAEYAFPTATMRMRKTYTPRRASGQEDTLIVLY